MSKVFNMVGGGGGPAASIFVTGLSETDTVTATNGGKTLTGKWTQKPNPAAHGLPDGYTELEYIESTGTQYIDTLLSLPKGYRLKGKLLLTSVTTSSRTIFGVEVNQGGTYGRNEFSSSWGKSNWFIGIGGYVYGGSPQANTEYEIDACNIIGKTPYIKINGASVSLTTGESDNGVRSAESCYLFACHGGSGATYFGYFRTLGAWEVYNENEELVGEYVPSKRNSDGAIGMYDLVTKAFFGNAGTGTFIAGAEIPQTIDGFLIKPIRDFGTWTVTATDGVHTKTQDVLVDVITEYEIDMFYGFITYFEEKESDWTEEGGTFNYGDGLFINRGVSKGTINNGGWYYRKLTIPIGMFETFSVELDTKISSSSQSDSGKIIVRLMDSEENIVSYFETTDVWAEDYDFSFGAHLANEEIGVKSPASGYNGTTVSQMLIYDGTTISYYMDSVLIGSVSASLNAITKVEINYGSYSTYVQSAIQIGHLIIKKATE